jgi:hypothetical protein
MLVTISYLLACSEDRTKHRTLAIFKHSITLWTKRCVQKYKLRTISLNQKNCLRLAMDACGGTDHVKTVCAGDAGLTEDRSVS